MALAHPHIGMQAVVIQAVAIALLLGFQHELAEGIRIHEHLLAALKDHLLKAEAGVNVADDLGSVLQLGFDQGDLLRLVRCLADSRGHYHTLVKGGGSLRQRHGVVVVQRAVILDALIVEGMAQFVGQSDHIGEHTVKIGEDTALAQAFHTGTECAAGLAISGIEVDPGVVIGGRYHLGQFTVEFGEQVDQIFPGVLGGELGGGSAHGGEQIIPGQTVFMSQCFALGLQILPELGQILVHSSQHGVQGFPLHVGVLQRPLQGRGVATELTIGNSLQLDGIQGKGHGILNAVIALQLCLVSGLSHSAVGIIGKIPNGG